MAESETALANRALTLIGSATISSLTDNDRVGRLVNTMFAQVRDDVLSEANWNCAIKRATIAADTDTPDWGFSNQFTLPADFIRLVKVEDVDSQFSLEGGKILSDSSTQKIKYVFRLTDVSRMDDAFKKAFAYKLAYELCLAMKGSTESKQSNYQLYLDALSQARMSDATQAPIETLSGSDWVDARMGIDTPFRRIALE